MKKRGPKPGPRPHTWIVGPDQHRHQLYVDCQRARAQARYRGEEWLITESEYIDLWMKDDQHLSKGRGRYDLTMTRLDPELAWTRDNVVIMTRLDHLRRCNLGQSRRRHYA